MPIEFTDSDGNLTYVGLALSEPVTINWDDLGIDGAGVEIPFPEGVFPTHLLVDVVVVSDNGAVYKVVNSEGDDMDASGDGSPNFNVVGRVWVFPIGNNSTRLAPSFYLKRNSGAPSQGQFICRIAYISVDCIYGNY